MPTQRKSMLAAAPNSYVTSICYGSCAPRRWARYTENSLSRCCSTSNCPRSCSSSFHPWRRNAVSIGCAQGNRLTCSNSGIPPLSPHGRESTNGCPVACLPAVSECTSAWIQVWRSLCRLYRYRSPRSRRASSSRYVDVRPRDEWVQAGRMRARTRVSAHWHRATTYMWYLRLCCDHSLRSAI